MADLQQETTPPLAWDHDGMPFQPPAEAIAWKVRRYSGNRGRPPVVHGDHGPLHVDLDATIDDLRLTLGNAPGAYRLYPVSEVGEEMEPIACIEVKPLDGDSQLAVMGQDSPNPAQRGPLSVGDQANGHALDAMELCRMMVASRDAHDQLMASMLTTMVQSTATIQQSMAQLLTVTNNTIKVANGTDALERMPPPPEINVQELADGLSEALGLDEEEDADSTSKSKGEWLMQFISSPVGGFLVQTLGKVTTGIQEAQAAKTEAAKAEARAQAAHAAAAEARAKEILAKAQARQGNADSGDDNASNADGNEPGPGEPGDA